MKKMVFLLCMLCIMGAGLSLSVPAMGNENTEPAPIKSYNIKSYYEPIMMRGSVKGLVRSSGMGALGGAAMGYLATGRKEGMVVGAFGGAVLGKDSYLLRCWLSR